MSRWRATTTALSCICATCRTIRRPFRRYSNRRHCRFWTLSTSRNRRQLLLEGYPNSTFRHWRKPRPDRDPTDLEYWYGNFHVLVRGVHGKLTEQGHLLPPLEETLSPTALKRFESLDPLMQASFRLWWETRRTKSPSDDADRLEQDLLDMPTDLPDIRELGLSEAAVKVLERESEIRDYALGEVAANLVLDQEWDGDDAARLQEHIDAYEEPGWKRGASARAFGPAS